MEKINVVEILKDCPEGMELDCVLFNDVTFEKCAGDSIYIRLNNGGLFALSKYGNCYELPNSECVIFPKGKTTWEGFVPPVKFKDGDIVTCGWNDNSKSYSWTCIVADTPYRISDNYFIKDYCSLDCDGVFVSGNSNADSATWVRLATEEEKQRLFKAIEDNGYKWNAEKKCLEKLREPKFKVGDKVRVKNGVSKYRIIDGVFDNFYSLQFFGRIDFTEQDRWELVPDKFDINTLKHYDKVLGRDTDNEDWKCDFFSHYGKGNYSCKFVCVGMSYRHCIPFKGNEHLCGTSDDCAEFYKTWEE